MSASNTAAHVLQRFQIQRPSELSVQQQIEQHIESMIRGGQLGNGQRLPSTSDLAKNWRVNLVSVQRAMANLHSRGLLVRKTRRGTFVRQPTSTMAVGILVGNSLSHNHAFYQRSLVEALRQLARQRDWSARIYDDLKSELARGTKSPVVSQVMADGQSHRFTAMVQIGLGLSQIELIEEQLPMTRVRCSQIYRASDVINDGFDFAFQAITHLHTLGVRQVFGLGFLEYAQAYDGLQVGAQKAGLPAPVVEPLKRFGQAGMEAAIFDQTIELIHQWRQSGALPMGLIVSDDIAMRSVAMAVLRENVRVPQELTILTMANRGSDIHYGLPVIRYEFDALKTATTALDLLASRMRGENDPLLPVMVSGQLLAASTSHPEESREKA